MILYVVRGLPGSGKSTLARRLTRHQFEADQYFVQPDGSYDFERSELGKAHAWCRDQVEKAMADKVEEVAVSNTFTQKWEYQPYLNLAAKHGYQTQIIACAGDPAWANTHDVPQSAIERMRERWEH